MTLAQITGYIGSTLISFRTQIIRFVGISLLSIMLLMLVSVWFTTFQSAKDRLNQDMKITTRILSQWIQNQNQQLYMSAQVLTSDFGFKQAVATFDNPTVSSMLINHQRRIQADFMAILRLDGSVLATSTLQLTEGQLQLSQLLADEGSNSALDSSFRFVVLDNQIYSLTLMPVKAPQPIALAVIGVALGQEFVEELSAMTSQDITITYENSINNSEPLKVSSLQISDHSLRFLKEHDIDFFDVLLLSPNDYISKESEFHEHNNSSLTLTLIQNAKHVFASLKQLQFQISMASLFTLFIAGGAVALLSKKLMRPFNTLAERSKKIALGNYDDETDIGTNIIEIHNIAQSFEVMQKQIRKREEDITYQANHDLLTGLYNRKKMNEILNEAITTGERFFVVQISITNLTNVFDVFGYIFGERFLKAMAANFNELLGTKGRVNGSEFILILKHTHVDAVAKQLTDAKQSLTRPYTIDGQTLEIDVAIAALHAPEQASTVDKIFMRLNIASAIATHDPRPYLFFTDDYEKDYLYKLEILNELKNELQKPSPDFQIHYQPKFRLSDLKPLKAEALIRWTNGKLGFIPPDVFIPLAEQAGLIQAITEWVIRATVTQQVQWKSQGIQTQLAINLSIHDIENPNMLVYIMNDIESHGLDVNDFSFEVTESGVMNDPSKVLSHLQQFCDQGFSLAIDDFGTGYSSLSYLKNMPIRELKIDKAFVLHLNESAHDQHIVQTVLTLSKGFQLECVAEGVEDQKSLDLLKLWGCEWVQGFHLSRPIPSTDFAQWYLNYERNRYEKDQA